MSTKEPERKRRWSGKAWAAQQQEEGRRPAAEANARRLESRARNAKPRRRTSVPTSVTAAAFYVPVAFDLVRLPLGKKMLGDAGRQQPDDQRPLQSTYS